MRFASALLLSLVFTTIIFYMVPTDSPLWSLFKGIGVGIVSANMALFIIPKTKGD